LNDTGKLGVRVVGEGDIARFVEVEMLRDSVDGVWVAGLDDIATVIVVGQDYVKDGVPLVVTLRESGS
jgi:multidrug efflux system membrane fusion protein